MRNFTGKQLPKKITKGNRLADDAMYFVGLISPLMTLPQAISVWTVKNTSAVSVPTWGAYALVSFLWVFYGWYKKEYPVFVTNFLLFIMDSIVVLGVLINRY